MAATIQEALTIIAVELRSIRIALERVERQLMSPAERVQAGRPFDPVETEIASEPPPSEPAAFTVAGVAERWGVSVDTVYSMIRAGRLNAFKFGGRLHRVKASEVRRFENEEPTHRKRRRTSSER